MTLSQDVLSVYIPTDRRHALALDMALPDRMHGAALFADISGFTPLAESLVRALGPHRGAEELTRYLNLVYDALIAVADRFRGSVVTFAGDAITCWFDGDSGRRATACALELQQAMVQFAHLALPSGDTIGLTLKVAVAAGPVRRFVVGDPAIQIIDVMAGVTLDRLAAAEHEAQKGEVVVCAEVVPALDDHAVVAHRADLPYAVVEHMEMSVEAVPWPPLLSDALTDAKTRPWLLLPVAERLRSGQGEFLAELRPAVALFLRFEGIDYDADVDAEAKLDAYIRWVQAVFTRYEGFLIELSMGDKGSYLFAAFGAPIVHDDDASRAVVAALALSSAPPELAYIRNVQIGISGDRCGQARMAARPGATTASRETMSTWRRG
ncbi:MAG TPA: adenylate/guanylate cyclase domain-containing protein [Herpetosiphonaceae bacterium]|nr:adenylate/guanylate cyclase domain-containing protein [Herpetosiphonaceae bacterium]